MVYAYACMDRINATRSIEEKRNNNVRSRVRILIVVGLR